jgi:hypothetical protein
MTRSRALVILQLVAAVAAVLLVPGTASLLGEIRQSWEITLYLMAATVLLTAFGVWLPRGDIVDNSAALAFVAGCFVEPRISVASMAVAWVVGVVGSRRKIDVWRLLERIGRRALLMTSAYVIVRFVLARGYAGFSLFRVLGPSSSMDPTLAYALVGGCGVVFVMLDLLLDQLQTSSRLSNPIQALFTGVLQLRGWMIVAEMSVAVLCVLIYPTMNIWGVAIGTGMLLVMRQSFSLLLDIRSSYTATVEVLARSLEAYEPDRRGHAERVANLVAEAARRLGFQSKRLEDVTYAALFHDVSRLGTDDEYGETERTSSEVLAGVNLLDGAMPILRLLDAGAGPITSPDEHDVVGAYLIARFSSIDTAATLGHESDGVLEEAIGARLYAATRRTADRVIRQVEQSTGIKGDSAPPVRGSA